MAKSVSTKTKKAVAAPASKASTTAKKTATKKAATTTKKAAKPAAKAAKPVTKAKATKTATSNSTAATSTAKKAKVAAIVDKKVKNILISQPRPTSEKSPYYDLAKKYDLNLTFHQFIKVEGLTVREFRKQEIEIGDYMGVIMLSRNAVDHFFRLCEEMKFKVSPDMRYFCATEAVALYLQKFILYRKRKVFFSADGSPEGLMDVVGKFKDKEKFLMPVSEFTKNDISKLLVQHKVVYQEAVMYRTVGNALKEFNPSDYDMMILFSPFGVDAVLNDMPEVKKNKIRIGTFGNTTTEAAEKAGLNLVIKAPTVAAPSMVTAIDIYLKSQS